MSEATVLVTDAKALATSAISWLTGQVGQQLVADVWAVLTGQSEQEILEDLSGFVAGVLRNAQGLLEADEIAAAIQAANLAVDKTVDAMEAARLAAMATGKAD